jgi:hypothetical protein
MKYERYESSFTKFIDGDHVDGEYTLEEMLTAIEEDISEGCNNSTHDNWHMQIYNFLIELKEIREDLHLNENSYR